MNTTVNDLIFICARKTRRRTFSVRAKWTRSRFEKAPLVFTRMKRGSFIAACHWSFTFHCFVTTNVWPSKDSPQLRKRTRTLLLSWIRLENLDVPPPRWIRLFDVSQEPLTKGVKFYSFTDKQFISEMFCWITSSPFNCQTFFSDCFIERRVFFRRRAWKHSPAKRICGTHLWCGTKAFNWYEIWPRGSGGGRPSGVLCPPWTRYYPRFHALKKKKKPEP